MIRVISIVFFQNQILDRGFRGQSGSFGHVIYQNVGSQGRKTHFSGQTPDQSTLTGALIAPS